MNELIKATAESGQKLMRTIHNHDRFLLTLTAGVGTVVTAVLSARGAVRAHEKLKVAEEEKGAQLSTFEKVKVAAPEMAPAAVACVITEVCNATGYVKAEAQIGTLVAALEIADRNIKTWQEETEKMVGPKKTQLIEGNVTERHFEEDPPVQGKNIANPKHGRGNTLVRDVRTGQYFYSSVNAIEAAATHYNDCFVDGEMESIMYSSVASYLGEEECSFGDICGFDVEHWLYPKFTSKVMDEFDRGLFGVDSALELDWGYGKNNIDGGPVYNIYFEQ